jgi:hypothetical protein
LQVRTCAVLFYEYINNKIQTQKEAKLIRNLVNQLFNYFKALTTLKSLNGGTKFLFTNEVSAVSIIHLELICTSCYHYLIFHIFFKTLAWSKAKDHCESIGLHLAILDSDDKIKEISLQFRPKTGNIL